MKFLDDVVIQIGTGNDLRLTHQSGNSFIHNNTGTFNIEQRVDDGDLVLKCDDGSGGNTAYITLDGSAELVNFDKATRHLDSVIGYFGTGLDFRIQHNGSANYIQSYGGAIYIDQNVDDSDISIRNDDGSGGVTIYEI